jgi:feruloyl-CoA synthase
LSGENPNKRLAAAWTTVTYKDALWQVRSAAAWVLARGLSAERPLVILSDNSIDHALFALGAMPACRPPRSRQPIH